MKHYRLFAAALLVATPAAAQTTPQDAPPVFRSGLELVRLDVRVTDDRGRPIADLRPDEIRVEAAGTPRPILLFQHVEAPEGTYADAAQRTIAAQVSTNQGSPQGHVYVLVFDEAHILPGHEQRARLAAERFLRTHVRQGDRVALYALPGPGPQIPFTADVRRVSGALTAVRGAGEQMGGGSALTPVAPMRIYEAYEIARGNQKVLDRVTNEVATNLLGSDTRTSSRSSAAAMLADDYDDNRKSLAEDARAMVARADGDSRRFLLAFADVIRTLRSIDGRKAVMLFSEGFQTDNVTRELGEVAAAAAQSYSVVYAMDLNPRTADANAETPREDQSSETLDKLQALGSLTAETSGTLVSDAAAQIDRAMERIAKTSDDYYVVGFTPPEGDRGAYRLVHVSVSRPGAHVSTRTGYSMTPKVTPADRRRAIDAALQAPFAQKGLEVEYTTYELRGPASNLQRVVLSLAAELPVRAEGARDADVVYVVRDVATGKVAASGTDRIPLPGETKDRGTTGTGFYRVQFELPAGAYLMRAVVREPGGLVGSADRRFHVRALNGPDVSASDLVLGSSDVKGLPVRASAYASDVLTGVFELYARSDVALEEVAVTADLLPIEGGPTAVSVAAALQPVVEQDGGRRRGAHVDLPLTNVRPGQYLVRATVRRGRDAITELFRDVSVLAGTRPGSAAPAPTPFDPIAVLHGDVGRRLIEAIGARAANTALAPAARAAAAGGWPNIEAALPESTPAMADALTLRGIAAFARGDFPAAASSLRAAQEAGAAADSAVAFILGWAHAAGGNDRAAITAWRSALVTETTLIPPYLALVDAYVRLGEPALALQIVDSGLRVLPGSPELLSQQARLQHR
jgi:VWFA-related protein